MKIRCKRKDLEVAVTNVQRAVSGKSTIPALEGIYFRAEAGTIELCGTNLELGITTELKVDVEESGEAVLQAKLIGDIVRKLPEETVIIESGENDVCNIRSGNSEFTIAGIPPMEYPELPTLTETIEIGLSSTVLKSMIRQTLFAVAETDAKPVHTGTLFEIQEGELTLVSVDGYRLALRKEAIGTKDSIRFVVPGKTLQEILKLIPEEEENLEIQIGKRHVQFRVGDYQIISRLLDGEFLDYKSAIPTTKKTGIRVNARRFIESVERVSLLVTDRLKSPIRCIFAEGEGVKTSSSTSIGKANDAFEAEVEGERVEIGFNNRYLLDALRNTEGDEIQIHINGALSPMKIVPLEKEDLIFLVLPVRLKTEEGE